MKHYIIFLLFLLFFKNSLASDIYTDIANDLRNFKVSANNYINSNTSSYFICGFPDVKYSHKNCQDINYLKSKNWIRGKQTETALVMGAEKKKYLPDSEISRGDFILIYMRAAGLIKGNESCNDKNVESSFNDVYNNQYFCYAIYKAKENGIIKGINGGSNKFEPLKSINRAEALKIIIKSSHLIDNFNNEKNEYIDHNIYNVILNKISNISESTYGDDWYKTYVDLAKEEKIKGYQSCYDCIDIDNFENKQSFFITRGEVASLIRELVGAMCYGRSITNDMNPSTVKNGMNIKEPNCNQIKSYYFYSKDGLNFIGGMINSYNIKKNKVEMEKNIREAFISLFKIIIGGFEGNITAQKMQLLLDTILNNAVIMELIPGSEAEKIKIISGLVEAIAGYLVLEAKNKNIKNMKDILSVLRGGVFLSAQVTLLITDYSSKIYAWYQNNDLDSNYHSIMISASFLNDYYKNGMPIIKDISYELKVVADKKKYSDSTWSFIWNEYYDMSKAKRITNGIMKLVNERKQQYYIYGDK